MKNIVIAVVTYSYHLKFIRLVPQGSIMKPRAKKKNKRGRQLIESHPCVLWPSQQTPSLLQKISSIM